MMYDVTIKLENRPAALAEMGEALAAAGISIEGGGAWVVDNVTIAHFLFTDGVAAREALLDAGIEVMDVRPVVVQRLKQEVPGQLGKLTRKMAEANVNIEVLYSDHDNQLILVVDNFKAAERISHTWQQHNETQSL